MKSADEVQYTIRHGDLLPEPPILDQELRSIADVIDQECAGVMHPTFEGQHALAAFVEAQRAGR